MRDLIYRLQSISLKWKLLIPFMLFSFLGIFTLAFIGLSSQEDLIKKQEKRAILRYYRLFFAEIDHKRSSAIAVATAISTRPEVATLLAAGDRDGLMAILEPVFHELSSKQGISIIHIHEKPGKSFLRLHMPAVYGDDLYHRRSVIRAIALGESGGGAAWGKAGLGIRGVVPVRLDGKLIGSIEVGYSFDRKFLLTLKEFWGPDFTEMEKEGEGDFKIRASTLTDLADVPFSGGFIDVPHEEPLIYIGPKGHKNSSVLIGSLRDLSDETVGLIRIDVDRSDILAQLVNTRLIMAVAGISGCLVSSILIWVVAMVFLRPIREIVKESREIASGTRRALLARKPADEVGELTRSLNIMLISLQQKQAQIEDYARTLEIRVRDRTADLIESEEKYRTLVENLPLIVYRLQTDGTTEFVNPCFTETLGFTPEEVISDRNFWRRHICGKDEGENILSDCWGDDSNFRTERVVRSKDGRNLTFIDHSIPCVDQDDSLLCIEGIMIDITELKRLQERALRTEELRVLGGISERFAHELRNPLASAGGFARRLRDALPQESSQKRFADIIVQEVARLEEIVRLMLSAIRPVVPCYAEIRIGEIVSSMLPRLQAAALDQNIRISSSVPANLPESKGDTVMLSKAFETLMVNAILGTEAGGEISINAKREDDHIILTVEYPNNSLGKEDLAQYFFPRIETGSGPIALELPLSKVIIHRHGGKIDVSRGNLHNIIIRIELPIEPHVWEEDGGNGSVKVSNGQINFP